VHLRISAENIRRARADLPGAVVIVHPECTPDVVDIADEVLSTSGMRRFVASSKAKTFIVGTEATFLDRLAADNPGKRFYFPGPASFCPNMKLCTPEGIVEALRGGGRNIEVPEPVLSRARRAIDRMMAAGGGTGGA
jgi:quinolinate synthase